MSINKRVRRSRSTNDIRLLHRMIIDGTTRYDTRRSGVRGDEIMVDKSVRGDEIMVDKKLNLVE